MGNIKFEGIMPALITPFNDDNKTINEISVAMLELSQTELNLID